ncbi:MAG: cytochrome P450 [Bryobacteraceae bacterium]
MEAVAERNVIPPGPKGVPFFGSIRAFRKDAPRFLIKAAAEFGPVSYFRLANQRVFFINDAELVKEILVTNQGSFKKSRALERAKILLGNGLLTNEGEAHLKQRRLVQPAFHRERLAGYATSMVDLSVRARNRWADGSRIEMHAEMMRLTLAIVAETLFRADVETEAAEIGEALSTVLAMFNLLFVPFSEWLEKLPLPAVRRFEKARARLDQTIYKMISERRASGEDRGDLLSMLLLAQDEGAGMSDEQVRDEAMTLFLAGHETTANALTWTWYLLSQHPEIEARMHEEIDRELGGRLPTFDDVPRLAYTERVLAEGMRLYPPAWAIGRRAKVDYQLGEYAVPAHSILLMSPYAMHRNPRYWPEPERFDPDRFLPEASADRPKFSYFPFGGGARLCIGERFAWMEGVLVLATLGQKWRFRFESNQEVAYQAMITLRTRGGVPMRVEAR